MKDRYEGENLASVLRQVAAGDISVQTAFEVLSRRQRRGSSPMPDVYDSRKNALKREAAVPCPEAKGLRAWRRDYENAVSCLVVRQVERDPEVLAFRRKVLGGEALDDPAKARKWLGKRIGAFGGAMAGRLPDSRKIFLLESPKTHTFKFPRQDCPELEWLKSLSVRLSRKCSWLESAATLFVLTQWFMIVPGISATLQRRRDIPFLSRIVLEIDPAMPVEHVVLSYMKERDTLRQRWRSLSNKHLRLASFAALRPDESWYKLMESWNHIHALDGWAYGPQILTKREEGGGEEYQLDYPDSEEEFKKYEQKQADGFANFRRDVKQAIRRIWDAFGDQRDAPLCERKIGSSQWAQFLADYEHVTDYVPPWEREGNARYKKENDV